MTNFQNPNNSPKKSTPLKILSILGGTVAVFLAIFIIVVAAQPSEFKITRSMAMNAPAAIIFPQVNNVRTWQTWSPWAKLDPSAKTTFEGPNEGVGAKFAWNGNDDLGQGSMAITESRPYEYIRFQMEFLKPMQASNITEFSFTPQGGQTVVSWSMSGKNNFIGKVMSLVFNCDSMVGEMFEKGLSTIKVITEAKAEESKN